MTDDYDWQDDAKKNWELAIEHKRQELERNKAARAWSDQFIPQIIQIVGPHLLVPATFEQDTQQATDLVTLRAQGISIACRMRKPGYLPKFANDFTIRSNPAKHEGTELDKIERGYADWMFYGHASSIHTPEGVPRIGLWHLLDLSVFRDWWLNNPGVIVRGSKTNDNGATHFTWFNIQSFPPEFVIAKSED